MARETARRTVKGAALAAAALLCVPPNQSFAQEAAQPQAEQAREVPAPQPAKRSAGAQAQTGRPRTLDVGPAEPATPAAAPTDEVPAESAAPAETAAPAADAAPTADVTPAADAATAADQIADIFSKIGDQIYEECIFELSPEQVDVQFALMMSYLQQGATSTVASRLAAEQIQPPKLSEACEQIRRAPNAATSSWEVTTREVPKPAAPTAPAAPKAVPEQQPPSVVLANKKGLPQWDCAPGVDYVTIKLNGYERKLTGGEICSPFEDVVREVPASVASFRLGYTIKTGRLFVISDDPQVSGKTIAWGLSGRDVCRNNPDPDCFAARAIGPLPPGEYSFAGNLAQRVSFGPRTKRNVAGVYLKKLWNKELFSAQQKAAVLARGNIAIHMRLKGEMSEACIGLEPKGWAYVAGLIKEGRATALDVYIDEPHPQIAEAPPVVVASSFSLTSLFK